MPLLTLHVSLRGQRAAFLLLCNVSSSANSTAASRRLAPQRAARCGVRSGAPSGIAFAKPDGAPAVEQKAAGAPLSTVGTARRSRVSLARPRAPCAARGFRFFVGGLLWGTNFGAGGGN